MGSFHWEQSYDDYPVTQYHNGRPLSVALTEPDESNHILSDFTPGYPLPRSRSVGRRMKRESYTFHYPNPIYQPMHYPRSSGDMFIEKLETVTIEEEKRRPSLAGMLSHVRNSTPVVRQLKIRSRPSSSFNLHERDSSTDQRSARLIDERCVQDYHYEYFYKIPLDQTVPIKRESTQSSDDLTIIKPNRPIMKDSSTTTADLPRKLSRSETQIIERFEKEEKIPSSTSITESITYNQKPVYFSSQETIAHPPSTAYIGKHHRIRLQPELSWKPVRTVSVYSDFDQNRVIVRPTAKPREALVDTPSIVAPPANSDTLTSESRRSYFHA